MNRTILLIIILIASVAGLLSLSLNMRTAPSPVSTPVSVAQTTLTISTPTASTSGVLTSDILINTNGNKVSAVQIELSYDPNVLGNVDIASGPFFKTPVELFKKIDTVNGRVSFASGGALGKEGLSGRGVVAKLSFTKFQSLGTTSISFLPKSLVSTEGVTQSVLKSATGLTLDLSK